MKSDIDSNSALLEPAYVGFDSDWRVRALEAAGEGIVITDPRLPDNPIIYVNQGFRNITGYGDEEVLGRNCRFMRGARTDPAATELIQQSLRQAKPVSVELINYRKGGEPFVNRLHISPVFHGSELTHFVGVQLDITDVRKAEREALESRDKLLSGARMAVLGRLAVGLAHEINNPMTGALLISERARRRIETWKYSPPTLHDIVTLQNSLENIESLCRRVTSVVTTFRSLEPKNDAAIDNDSCLLATALDFVLKQFDGCLSDAGLKVRHSGRWELKVIISSMELAQVFSSVIENSIDSTESLQRRELSLNVSLIDERRVLIECIDTAPRLNDSIADSLFVPFFTTKDPGKGVGLGLYLARTLCEKHGGSMRLHRNPTSNIFEIELLVLGSETDTGLLD